MTNANARLVDDLKTAHPYAAGALARSLGMPEGYGCHFGMRSSVDYCRAEYAAGYAAANARAPLGLYATKMALRGEQAA